MKKVYFIRHGETDWNKLRKIQGQVDNPLNETGRAEASKAAVNLESIPFGICFSSPLERARETAKIILGERTCPVIIDERLIEIAYGVDEGQDIDWIYQDAALPLHNYFLEPGKYIPPENGETLEHLYERCAAFLQMLEEQKDKLPDDILVTCHGGVIRGMITVVEKLSQNDFWNGKPQANCSMTVMTLDQKRWKMEIEAQDITFS